MAWNPVATIELSTDWRVTAPVIGRWFRVQHTIAAGRTFRRGYIAQAAITANIELHGIRRMYSKPGFDVFELIQPEPWELRSVAVRSYFPSRFGEDWTVLIEVWESTGEPDFIEMTVED